VIERQGKQLERKKFWDTVGGIFLFIAGAAIGFGL